MRNTKYLFWVFVFLISLYIIYAATSYQIGDYLLKDNSSYDKFGNVITLNDSLNSHGWESILGGTSGARYSTTPDGKRVINITSGGSSWNTSWGGTANKTYTASTLWSTKVSGGANQNLHFKLHFLSKFIVFY